MELVNRLSKIVDIPIVAHGGAGKKLHFLELFENKFVDAAMASSILHYNFLRENESIPSSLEGNVEFLSQKRTYKNFESFNIQELKKNLKYKNINCRI